MGKASVASKEGKIDGVSEPSAEGASEGEKQDGGDNDAYEVEKLLQVRKTKGAWKFLVKWVGYDSTENSWVTYSDLVGDSIGEYGIIFCVFLFSLFPSKTLKKCCTSTMNKVDADEMIKERTARTTGKGTKERNKQVRYHRKDEETHILFWCCYFLTHPFLC